MASLFSLMPAGAGPIPLERLEAAAESEVVLVDCLTDEELYWLREGAPDPAFDEPYLVTLANGAREAALDSGLRSLIAKGMVDVDPDELDTIEILGVYGLLARCRREATSVALVVLDVMGEPAARWAFHRVSEVLVLVEEISHDGFHDFAFQSLDSAATTLASIFDRRRIAGEDSGPQVRATSPDALDPSPDTLLAEADHVVSIAWLGDTGEDVDMTVYGTLHGIWTQWSDPGAPIRHVMARMGGADLFVLATDIITGRTPTA